MGNKKVIDVKKILADNLIKYRTSKNLSLQKLAELCRVSRKTVVSVESMQEVRLTTIIKFARGIGCQTSELLAPDGIDKYCD